MESLKIIITLSKLGGTAFFMKNPPLIYKLYQYTIGSLLWVITTLSFVYVLTKTDDLILKFKALSTTLPLFIPSTVIC